MLSIIEKMEISKLNFEVNATATKVMTLVGLLSAASPTLAKNPDSFSSNSGKSGVRTEKEIELPEALAPTQAQEWMTHTAPADALSVESINDLTDIIPLGAPEVFDDGRTEPWKREVMPNPFNPSTTIEFEIPESQNVTIEVFNLLGEKVATLLRGYIYAGPNKVEFNARDLASGMYIYRIVTEKGVIASKKMVLLK